MRIYRLLPRKQGNLKQDIKEAAKKCFRPIKDPPQALWQSELRRRKKKFFCLSYLFLVCTDFIPPPSPLRVELLKLIFLNQNSRSRIYGRGLFLRLSLQRAALIPVV